MYLQSNSVYDSTHFDNHAPMNPLYAASLQSPDSIAGYSIDSSSSLDGYQQNLNSNPHWKSEARTEVVCV